MYQSLTKNASLGYKTNRAIVANFGRQEGIKREQLEARQKMERILTAAGEATQEIGRFDEGFRRLAAQSDLSSAVCAPVAPEDVRWLSGNDTSSGNFDNPVTFSIGSGIAIKKGDRLAIRVDGQWIADQALQAMGFEKGALVGPQGYMQSAQYQRGVNSADSRNRTTSRTSSKSSDWYVDAGITYSAGVNIMGSGITTHLSTGVRAGEGMSEAEQSAKSSQQGTFEDKRTVDSFVRALKCSFAPFPEEAVGALLLIQYCDGKIHHTEALSTSKEIMSKVNGQAFFVVNDIRPSPGNIQSRSPALTVRTMVMRPITVPPAEVGTAMSETLCELDRQYSNSDHISASRMTAEDIRHLASDALKIRGFNVDALPAPWKMFFFRHVSLRRANFERHVFIHDLEDNLEILGREVELLNKDTQMVRHEQAVLALHNVWRTGNLDYNQLRDSALDLVTYLQRTLVPFLRVTAQDKFSIETDRSTLLECGYRMIQFPEVQPGFDAPAGYFTNVDALTSASRTLLGRARNIRHFSPLSRAQEIILVIPRPLTDEPPSYLTAPSDVRERVWTAIVMRQSVSFCINPSDLFRPDLSICGALDLRDNAPIIDAMTIHFTTDANIAADAFNRCGFSMNVEQGQESTFVCAGGNLNYISINPQWRHPRVPITCGFCQDLHLLHEQRLAGPRGRGDRAYAAAGMSPFSVWTFDFSKCDREDSPLNSVLENASSMNLVFTLLSTRSHQEVVAIP